MSSRGFNFPKPFQPNTRYQESSRPEERLNLEQPELVEEHPPKLQVDDAPRIRPPSLEYKPPEIALFSAKEEPSLVELERMFDMDYEELNKPTQPKSSALPAKFIEKDEEVDRENETRMQALLEKLNEYKNKLKDLRDKNLELAKTSYERAQEVEQLKLEKDQLEEELNLLGLNDKRGIYGNQLVPRQILNEDDNQKKIEMKRELMLGIALVEGDFTDFLTKKAQQKSFWNRVVDSVLNFISKFTLLKGSLKRIEAQYDKSISGYFEFSKFLVNASVFILLLYLYLIVSHLVNYTGSYFAICGVSPCWLTYSSFTTDEAFGYSLTLIGFVLVTVFASLFKWVRSDAKRRTAQVYGGSDAKLKKFAAIALNAWDWNTTSEEESGDQSIRITNILSTALKDEARKREARNRTKRQKTKLLVYRLVGISLFVVILLIGWGGITFLVLSEKAFVDFFNVDGYGGLAIKLIPKLGVSVINAGLPALTLLITALENWDDPGFILKVQLVRLYLAKILNVVLFATLNLELASNSRWFQEETVIEFESDAFNCREDQAGSNLALLVVSEALVSKVIPLITALANKLDARMKDKQQWKKEIKVSQQVINLMYFQALIWMCLPFFPYIAAVAPLLLYTDYLFQLWRLKKLQVKPAEQTQASDITIMIMRVYNITLFSGIVYLGYFMTQKMNHGFYGSSNLCGAFENNTEANKPVIDWLQNNSFLGFVWNYLLDYSPFFWVVTVLLLTRMFFLKNQVKIQTRYLADKDEESKNQIHELQRTNARLRKQLKLNKTLM